MPDEPDLPPIPTLVEVGTRVINVARLILSERMGVPDPSSLVEVTLDPGRIFRLTGADAARWVSRLARFIPRDPCGGDCEDGATKITRRPPDTGAPGAADAVSE